MCTGYRLEMIAEAFIGRRNLWVIEFGMIACALVIPLALICGPLRGIPAFWRMIYCSFGVVVFSPLWLGKYVRRLTVLEHHAMAATELEIVEPMEGQ